MVFFSVITYVLLSSSPAVDFTIFDSLGILVRKKTVNQILSLNPKGWKNTHPLGIKSRLFTPRLSFFCAKSRGEKNRKIISFLPVFSDDRQFCIDNREIKKLSPSDKVYVNTSKVFTAHSVVTNYIQSLFFSSKKTI